MFILEGMKVKLEIKAMMKRRGYKTQASLAQAAGIHGTRIGSLVHGTVRQINLDTLARLCKALNCKPGDILVYED